MKKIFFLTLFITFAFIHILAKSDDECWHEYIISAGTQGVQSWEDCSMLFDNDTSTKWCVAPFNNAIYVEFDVTCPIIPIGYVLSTGDDTHLNIGRNPKSWTIKGRNSTSDDWTTLTMVENGEMPYESQTSKSFELNISTEYQYYRFEITSLVDGDIFQLSEFCFLINDDNPFIDEDICWNNYLATIGTAGVNSYEDYPKLLDNDTSTKWCVEHFNGTIYVEFDATQAIKPTGYVLTTGNDTEVEPGRNPKSWIIKGKNNINDEWTTLTTIDNGGMPNKNFAAKTFALSTITAYRYYRFEITSLVDGDVFQLSEFCFLIKNINDVIIEEDANTLFLGSNGSSPLFADCPLDSVFIGRNLSYSVSNNNGYSPFYRNTSLRSIHISDMEKEITQYEFYGCTNLKNVQLGDSITVIGDQAFSGCTSLAFFSFGTSVESIGQEAFHACTAMTKLVSRAPTPPVCSDNALDDINKEDCMLMVPDGSVATYQAAPQWRDFFFINVDPDGIGEVNANENVIEVARYDAQGCLISKGINIIRYSDGSTKKVLIK